MTTYCCDRCPHEPSCRDLLGAAFARPEDVTDDEAHIERGAE